MQNNITIDCKTLNAIIAYKNILAATKEIFGEENMTEEVMVKAIEAGSYGAWRSIMGGKDDYVVSVPYEGKRKRY